MNPLKRKLPKMQLSVKSNSDANNLNSKDNSRRSKNAPMKSPRERLKKNNNVKKLASASLLKL